MLSGLMKQLVRRSGVKEAIPLSVIGGIHVSHHPLDN